MLVLLAIIVTTAGLPVPDASGAAQSPSVRAAAGLWQGFRNDPSHTGRSGLAGPANPVTEWAFDTGGATYSSPAIAEDGTVYVGSADSVYAVGPDGRRRWATPIGGYAISSPAIGDDGTVYVGSRDHRLYALSPEDGSFKWAPFETGDEIWASPSIGTNGTILIGSFDGNLYAIDATTGTARWTVPIGSKIISSAAVGRDGTAYVGALDDNLYAVDPSGTIRWFFPTGGDIVSSPAVSSDGTIYVGSMNGNMYALAPDGGMRWEAPFSADARIVSSPAIGVNGTIYIATFAGTVYALTPNGTALWTFSAGESIIASPAVDVEGTVYFASYDGRLFALSPQGSIRWEVELEESTWSSPAIGPARRIYVASTDRARSTGYLHAVGSAPFEVTFRTASTEGVTQTLDITDPAEFSPTEGTLYYRRGGERLYREPVPLRSTGDGFEVDIPASDVTIRGIEYFIQLTDGRTTATYPATNPLNRPAVRRVQIGQSRAAAVEVPASGYAMVSIPVMAERRDVESILGDDHGAYAPSRWRVLRWEGGEYREHPSIGAEFTPGTAFFVTLREGGSFDVDEGLSVDTSRPYRITLEPGWNQVANPFAFDVAYAEIVHDPAAVAAVAYWNGSEMCQSPDCIDVWRPWEGYFVFNASSEPATILIPPFEAGTSDESTDEGARQALARASMLRLEARIPGTSWQDTQNWVGFADVAADLSHADAREAPPLDQGVRLSIIDGGARFARKLQSLDGQGGQWEIELILRDDRVENVELALIEETTLPEGFGIAVVDRDRGEVIPPTHGRYRIRPMRDRDRIQLSIVIGTQEYHESTLGRTPTRAREYVLSQNFPNPFGAETVIRYELAEPGPVELSVFDVRGRRVRTLIDGSQDEGTHSVVWDGRSDDGRLVASGTYLYRLRSTTSTHTRTMSLLH